MQGNTAITQNASKSPFLHACPPIAGSRATARSMIEQRRKDFLTLTGLKTLAINIPAVYGKSIRTRPPQKPPSMKDQPTPRNPSWAAIPASKTPDMAQMAARAHFGSLLSRMA